MKAKTIGFGKIKTVNPTPPAEDVLVQRIPGDDYHMLMMAIYADFKSQHSSRILPEPMSASEMTVKNLTRLRVTAFTRLKYLAT